MIIKINDNLQFGDWHQNISSVSQIFTWKRSLIRNKDNALLLEASVKGGLSLNPAGSNFIFMWSPFFYGSEINYLNDILNEIHPKYIAFELDKAKEFIDNFLIKLAGLTAFI